MLRICLGFIAGLVAVGLATATGQPEGSPSSQAKPYQVAVIAQDESHISWITAEQLRSLGAAEGIGFNLSLASPATSADPSPDFVIMPVRSLSTQVPELQVLELSFFYTDLAAVHRVLDGPLGESLKQAARDKGWEILAFWDEGMHIMSGLRRYDRAINLTGMEFIFTRPDPVAETQIRNWNAFPRRIQPEDNESVMRECMVASRATTLQQLWREQLHRVHLAIALTNHRYEGWVLAAPSTRWQEIPANNHSRLQELIAVATDWQHRDAQQREKQALARLRKEGVMIHEVDGAERKAFQEALPAWVELLPADLDLSARKRLVSLAATGTTVVTGTAVGATAVTRPAAGMKPGSYTTQGTPPGEANQHKGSSKTE